MGNWTHLSISTVELRIDCLPEDIGGWHAGSDWKPEMTDGC